MNPPSLPRKPNSHITSFPRFRGTMPENSAQDLEYDDDDEEFYEEIAEQALRDQFGDEEFERMMYQ